MIENKIQYSKVNLSQYISSNICGCYIITHLVDNHVEKYIGSTLNIRGRLHGHCDKNILYIETLTTDNKSTAESIERILIHLLKPSSNSMSYDLTTNDKKIMDELINNNIVKKLTEKEYKIGYRYLKYEKGLKERNIPEINKEKHKLKKINTIKATLSTTIEWEIAELIENDAVLKNISVSQLVREILTEKYKPRKKE